MNGFQEVLEIALCDHLPDNPKAMELKMLEFQGTSNLLPFFFRNKEIQRLIFSQPVLQASTHISGEESACGWHGKFWS